MGVLYTSKNTKKDIQKETTMKQVKQHQVGVKLNDGQIALLDKLITDGKAKTKASAIQYLINQQMILGSSK